MDLNYYDDTPGERSKVESTEVYLAKPGQRLIGVLNGIEKDSANLEINLNNTNVLEFTLDRIVDGLISNYYDLVERHYELYVPKYGWFKINEEPEMNNDGNIETKSVRAESLEIELQQYDLVNFLINTGNEASREYLATDNIYYFDDYKFFYDNVKFYRDTSDIENAISEFSLMEDTIENLEVYAKAHLHLLSSPRIMISKNTIDYAVADAATDYNNEGKEEIAAGLKKDYKKIMESDNNDKVKQLQYKSLAKAYPKLYNYITIQIDFIGNETGVRYTAMEILERELQRQNELSLMWLILHEHNWEVGFVDPWVTTEISDKNEWDKIIIDDDKIKLADKIGLFEIDSKDIYAFITQDMAAYFRCIFVFDTINRKVNCFNVNNIGYDTNIYLSFKNIMNSVTRSSDTDIYTVFHITGGDELDIRDVNFGEDYIEDISYFLNTNHFTREFIDKYQIWELTRDYNRPFYMRLSKEYRNLLDATQEILTRVPLDGADPQQYSSFSNDDLTQELANQQAMLNGYKELFKLEEDAPITPIDVPISLRVLGIGNSHTRDSVLWLCKILIDAGVSQVVVGNGYIASITLEEQYNAALNTSHSKHSAYEYMKYTGANPTLRISTMNRTLDQILADEPWDIVIFQNQSDLCGNYSSWVSNSFDINNFMNYVKGKINNSNVKFGIEVLWSHAEGYVPGTQVNYYEQYYGSNPRIQLKANINVAKQVALHMNCTYIVPAGQAINYGRRNYGLSGIRNSLLRDDGNHLEYGIPYYLVAMTYAMTFVPDINVTTVPWYPTLIDDPNIREGATDANAQKARQCAAAATGGDPYYDNKTNWQALKESIYWHNYKIIRDVIIPNIEIEITNRAIDTDTMENRGKDLAEEFNSDYKLNFDLYGDSYGVNELKYQLLAINNTLSTLKTNGYDKPNEIDGYATEQYNKYLKYTDAKRACSEALKDRLAEYNNAKKELRATEEKMAEVKNEVSKENERFGFTEDELKLLDRYYIHSDYENQNITTTSISTNEERVDLAYKLLLYAKDLLSAESHPLWDWSTTQDNLLLMPEFKDWYGTKIDGVNNAWQYTQLWIGNYIRVGFREDDSNKSITALLNEDEIQNLLIDRYEVPPTDNEEGIPHNGLVGTFVNARNEGYQAKLRVSQINLNPFLLDTTIGIEFTSMVQYKYRRNDFISILENGGSSSKNSISSGIASNPDKDNSFKVDANLMMLLMKSGAFTSYVSDIANSSGGGAAYSAVLQSLSNGSMRAQMLGIVNDSTIDVKLLTGSNEDLNNFLQNAVNASQIIGDFANIATIISDYINVEELVADKVHTEWIDAKEGFIGELETNILQSNKIIASILSAEDADFEQMRADDALVKRILTVGEDKITTIAEGTITTERIIAGLADAPAFADYSVLADSAFIQYLNTGVIETGQITTETLIATIARLTTAEVEQLNADNALIRGVLTIGEDLITTIANGAISTAEISADQITSGTIDSDLINVSEVLTIGTDLITTIAEGTITTENVVASLVLAQTGDFDDLTANSAFVQYLNSGIIEAGTVSADTIIAGLASVTDEQISKFDLLAGSAYLDYLESNLIVASEILVDDLKAKLATITVADIESMHVLHGFVESLQSFTNTTIEEKALTGYFYNLIAGNISVADLATHTASAQEIVLISDGQQPAIAFKNATQQFYDEDGNVRVQIGQDGNGDFNFIVRGADGTTALFNENGITQNGIPNSTIVNNMISDSTIQKSKLGFPIVETNQDGTINITSIKTGEGGNFGVEYTTFTQNTSDAIDDLSDDIDEINSKKMYRVVVESDNGNIFKNGDVNCTLYCRVYSWDNEITDDINAAYFTWIRKSKDSVSDAQWNANHSGGTKSITLTPADVWGRSVFYCTVTLPDGSSVTGS